MAEKTVPPIQKIGYQGEIYAIVVYSSLPHKGYNFISDPQDSLQVGHERFHQGRQAGIKFLEPKLINLF